MHSSRDVLVEYVCTGDVMAFHERIATRDDAALFNTLVQGPP